MLVRDGSIEVETPTGPMRTYVYEPAQPGRPEDRVPGVVLYSEIFQQTPPMRRLAVQIAGHGYLVMVPEVYHSRLPPGTVLGYDDEGKVPEGLDVGVSKKLKRHGHRVGWESCRFRARF